MQPATAPTSRSPREPFLERAFSRPAGASVRESIEAWAAAVASRLGALGCEVGVCTPRAEGLTAGIVLVRADKTTDRPGARIALSIAAEHVAVALELPAGEVGAARKRLADPVRALQLTTALQALPEQFTMGVRGVRGEERASPVSRASTDRVRALLDRAEREERVLWLGWRIGREVATAHAALLDEQLEDAAVALGSVLVILAPSFDGAPALVTSTVARVLPRRERRDLAGGEDDRPRAKRRTRERGEERERDGEADGEGDVRDRNAAAATHRVATAKGPVGAGVRLGRGATKGRSKPRASLDKGSRVRVLEGPFAGKVGVIQELDGRGGARVMLGLLAVRVDVRDLASSADGRDRPVLSTSHRKPMPVRS